MHFFLNKIDATAKITPMNGKAGSTIEKIIEKIHNLGQIGDHFVWEIGQSVVGVALILLSVLCKYCKLPTTRFGKKIDKDIPLEYDAESAINGRN